MEIPSLIGARPVKARIQAPSPFGRSIYQSQYSGQLGGNPRVGGNL